MVHEQTKVRSIVFWMLVAVVFLTACSPPPQANTTPSAKSEGVAIQEASLKYLEIESVGTSKGTLGGILPGRVAFRPQAMAAIGTPMAARVLSVDVRPGEIVKAGATLLTLQSADVAAARSALVQAEVRAAAAEDLLRRQNEMVKKGVGLEVERFGAEMAAREARAELDRAGRTVKLIGGGNGDRFVLRAPANGVVLAIRTNVGAVVSPGGDALVDVGDPNKLWVVADIPESEVRGITVGRVADVRVPGADARFEAVIDGVGQVVDGEQRRLPMYLALKGEVRKLSPGMLAEVRLNASNDSSLSLPSTAVLIKDGNCRVVYVQSSNGKFEARTVRTGVSRDGRVTILEGLQPGERVVVRGALLLDSEAEQLL